MMVKPTTTVVIIALIVSLVCSITLSSFNLPNVFHSYTALAFRPTNNHPPVANVGPNQTVNENATVMLVSAAVDPDQNDKLSYSWRQIAGPVVTLNGINTSSPMFTAPSNVPSDTQLKFALAAKDDKGAESKNTGIVTVTVKHINRPPTANAGTDQTVNPGYVVTLDGSKSKDSDNDPLTYSWKQVGGVPTVTLNGVDRSIATFTAPSNISSDTTLIFELIVTDDKNATGISTVKITVNPVNHPPIANAGTDQTVNPGYVVTLDGSKSKDPDNDPLTYSWKYVGGGGVLLGHLNGADKSIATFTAPDGISFDIVMTFELIVTDSKNATNSATVKVTDKYVPTPPNQPPVANAGSEQIVNAGDTVTLDGRASRARVGSITSYSWTQTDGPAISISGANTSTPSFTAPSVSSDTELKFSLTVTDKGKVTKNNNPATVSVIVKARNAEPSGGGIPFLPHYCDDPHAIHIGCRSK
jgi:large repetitive protein